MKNTNNTIRCFHHLPAGTMFGGEFSLPPGTFHSGE